MIPTLNNRAQSKFRKGKTMKDISSKSKIQIIILIVIQLFIFNTTHLAQEDYLNRIPEIYRVGVKSALKKCRKQLR